jgi:hypothetical protein
VSRSDWSRYYTPGLIALALLAALGGAGLLYKATKLQTGYESGATKEAKYYADAAHIKIERRCVPLAAPEEAKCRSEEREAAREGQRREYDLEAQRVTANWTRYMAYAAIVGMVVGIFGIGLIFVTFRETRSAASAARDTYDAFIAVERPRLIPRVSTVWKEGNTIHIKFLCENIGKSTAM